MLDLAEPELDVAETQLSRIRPRSRDHVRSHVDADHMALRADFVARDERVVAGARPEVEHRLPSLEGRVSGRHAATEIEVGLGDAAGDPFVGVADHVQSVGSRLRRAARGRATSHLPRDRAVTLAHQRPHLVFALHDSLRSALASVRHFKYSRIMEEKQALSCLSALAHETRLAIFRLLVQEGPTGMPAGEIALNLSVPSPTLSFHLKELERAGLIGATRQQRQIIYATDYSGMRALIDFIMRDCCQGRPELCGGLAAPACDDADKCAKEDAYD